MKLPPRIDDLLNDFAQLIDLDREHAAILVFVAKFSHRILKGAVDRFHAMAQQILEPDQKRKTEIARARLLHNFQKIDGPAVFQERPDFDIAGAVDRKVAVTPAFDVIRGNRGLDVPFVFHSDSLRRRLASPEWIINQQREHSSLQRENFRAAATASPL